MCASLLLFVYTCICIAVEYPIIQEWVGIPLTGLALHIFDIGAIVAHHCVNFLLTRGSQEPVSFTWL